MAGCESASNDPAVAVTSANLSRELLSRYERTGALADLETAIKAARAAVDAIPCGHPDRPAVLATLGNAVQSRFWLLGDVEDLVAATNWAFDVVGQTSELDPLRPARLSDLGGALMARFEFLGDETALHAAITAVGSAVLGVSDDHPDRPLFLTNLVGALVAKARSGDLAALDAAVEAAQDAVESTPDDDPLVSARLSNLCGVLQVRYDVVGEQSCSMPRSTPAAPRWRRCQRGSPQGAASWNNLGNALYSRFTLRRDPADGREALSAWRSAVVCEAAAETRIGAAQAWGDFAAGLGWWVDAADGFGRMVDLLPVLAWHGLGRHSQERSLARWPGLAADAAAAALSAHREAQAVERMEAGRAVLWSQLLDTDTELDALRAREPALAARLEEVRAALDSR